MTIRELGLLVEGWLKADLGDAEVRIDMGEDENGASYFAGISKYEEISLTETTNGETVASILLVPSEDDCFILDEESFVPKAAVEYDN